MTDLFTPARFGDLQLANRIVMAPLTRSRAVGGAQVPNELMARYYAQRADAGLIVGEATQVSPQGQGYLDTPGIHSDAQQAGWRLVTDAVHAAGGRIVAQLWHVGRISHVSLQPGGAQPVSSSARPVNSKTMTANGWEPLSSPPRALRTEEIPVIVQAYGAATRHAMAAGFDGVEIHAANGYLIEQFLRDSINDRDDAYGGPIANRLRFLREVLQAVLAEAGAGRTGIRLSPVTPANDAGPDSDPQALYGAVIDLLKPLRLAFVHMIEGATGGPRDHAAFDYEALRRSWKGANPQGGWIVNNGYTRAMAIDVLAREQADAVAFGRPFISNPDLVKRLRIDAELAPLRKGLLYGGSEAGYTDYPTMAG